MIDRFLKLFVPRENTIGVTKINAKAVPGEKIKAESTTEMRAVSLDDVVMHFEGKQSIGLSPLLLDNKCKWGCIDVDDYYFNLETFSKKYAHLPVFPCRTKSGGVHVYFFLAAKIKAKDFRYFMNEISMLIKLGGQEIYPKQDQAEKTDSANWLNMPYFDHENTARYCVLDGKKLSLSEFIEKAEKNKIKDFESVLEQFTLSGAPPCIQKIFSAGLGEGMRDMTLFATATFLKRKYPDTWEDHLKKINSEIENPLKEKDLQAQIIKAHKKKDYFYKCKDDLYDYCNKQVCLLRTYGIGSDNSPEKLIGCIKKLKTNPPLWYVEITGADKEIEFDTESLLSQGKFRTRVLESINKIIPLISRVEWEALIEDRLKEIVEIEAPEEASADLQLFYLIEQYCVTYSQTRVIEDVSRGKVFIQKEGDAEVNLFTAIGLTEYLKKKNYAIIKPNMLFSFIRKLGGDQVRMTVNNNRYRLWKLPLFESQKDKKDISPVDWDDVSNQLQGDF